LSSEDGNARKVVSTLIQTVSELWRLVSWCSKNIDEIGSITRTASHTFDIRQSS